MGEPRHPIIELTRARLREFYRERGAVFWSFGFPALLALVLGIAFRSAPEPLPRVGVASDQGDWLLRTLDEAEGLEVVRLAPEELDDALAIGTVAVVVEDDFDPYGQEGSERVRLFTYRFDPEREGSRLARLAVDDVLQRAAGRVDAVDVAEKTDVPEGGRYVDFLFPGILGMNLMTSSMWGLGYSIVLARKRKQLKRLAATPMRRSHLLLAFLFSRGVFIAAEVLFLLTFGALAFDVSTRGSFALLTVLSVAGAASFCAIALVIAARVESVESAAGWVNLVTLPMWLVSGTFFPYQNFPELLHLPIRALPLTAVNDALRAVMNEGAGVASLAPELLVIAAWTAAGLVLAGRTFRWQ